MDTSIYMIRSGRVQVLSSKDKPNSRILGRGGFFGRTSFDQHQRSSNLSVIALEDCDIGILRFSEVEAVLEKSKQKKQESTRSSFPIKCIEKHRILGIGTFGKVWLVSHRNKNGNVDAYALKVQRKAKLLRHNQVEGVMREISVMSQLDHPFILKMVSVHQDEKTIMMLLNLVQGGELYSIMKNNENPMLPKREAIFYASCILEGLHYMHNQSIVYRDLKPENVLIDKDGYAVMVDFGFAKKITGKTFTLVAHLGILHQK
jgi:Serine/threonine protein kinase